MIYRTSTLLLFVFSAFFYGQEIKKGEDGEMYVITHCMKRPVNDTLVYLKRFEINKVNYIGRPFSELLNAISPIQPKTVWSSLIGSSFNFTQKELSFHNAVTLLIEWQDPIPRTQTKFYEQKNAFYFTAEEKAFYGNKIVKDIIVYR